MTTTYLMTSTLNGFVAGPDNELDWLYDLPAADRDFSQFLSGVGALAMGASTYEAVLRDSELLTHPERWRQAHGDRAVWVFTHRELPAVPGANLRFATDVAAEHPAMLAAAGERDVFVAGGGALAAAFQAAGVLDRVVIGITPVLLAAGKPLFPGSARLRLTGVERQGQVAFLSYDVL
ncbi:dihydrofolate reductase family protein [Kribbella solani]|uniref:dihydrofolate reductase family protein n=1 Tax=Kribbella solani TaxID=236067 RepID=UPI0029A86D46|nr:dihydrofolate reductase family protein [Kribbella solani]MDX2968065.1 dihydrofolate reductase family protein [Kribbella solani]